LHRLGKTQDAVACFEAARRVAPDDDLVLTNLGVALADCGRSHEAVVVFRQALKRNPENAYVRHQLRRLISVIAERPLCARSGRS
jgi:Flp pilus assembly protein TadD